MVPPGAPWDPLAGTVPPGGSQESPSAVTLVRGSSKRFGNYALIIIDGPGAWTGVSRCRNVSYPKRVHLQRDCCWQEKGAQIPSTFGHPPVPPAIPLPVGAGASRGDAGRCQPCPRLLPPAVLRGCSRDARGQSPPHRHRHRGGGGGDGGAVRAGRCPYPCHRFSGRVAGPRGRLVGGGAAPSKIAEGCWCQPGKDQSLYQRVCVGGLIFVCRSQMVKEESDIIARAGAMKGEGERKSLGEARREEHGPVCPVPQRGRATPGGAGAWALLPAGIHPRAALRHRSCIQTSFPPDLGYTEKPKCRRH